MYRQSLRNLAWAFTCGIAVLAFSGWASADPPSRVARLGHVSGAVSFSPAGEDDWVRARINRPLTTGDRLWTDAGARTEIQVGGAMIRMKAGTAISLLNLDDRITQLQLTEGTLNIRVRHLDRDQEIEVDTPNLAFILRRAGSYRIEVDPDRDETTILVRKGEGEVYGEGGSYIIDSRQAYRFYGTGLSDYEFVDDSRRDDFDRWASGRDRRYDNSISARYVSQDVVGYQDLDEYGSWRIDATYGNVWFPNRVVSGWAPYRDGHWAWVDPWGWTWIDDVPWGFAVTHYGRWNNFRGTWGWVPGPVRSRAYYAPALVVFVGGSNFRLSISSRSVGSVAWFPLAPREVYRPSYPVSRSYFENINISNTVINTTVINNTYNNVNITNITYANRQVPGAVVAVPTTTFVQSQPVSRAAQQVSRKEIDSAPVVMVAPVAPTATSVRGAAAQSEKPPSRTFGRQVVARSAPPATPVGFAAQQQQLSAKPGRPLDSEERKALKPARAVPAPVVKVVAQPQAAPPTLRPPPSAPGSKAGDAGRKSDARKAKEVPAATEAPAAAPGTQAVPAAEAPEQLGKPAQRRNDDARDRSTQRKPPVADEPKAIPAPEAPPAPAMQQEPQDDRPLQASPPTGQRETAKPRERPVAPPSRMPPEPTQRAGEPGVAPAPLPQQDETQPLASPPETPAVQSATPPERRGKPGLRDRPLAQPSGPPAEQRRGSGSQVFPASATPGEPATQQAVPEEEDANAKNAKPAKPKGKKTDAEQPMSEEEILQEELLRDEQLKEEERLMEEERAKGEFRRQ